MASFWNSPERRRFIPVRVVPESSGGLLEDGTSKVLTSLAAGTHVMEADPVSGVHTTGLQMSTNGELYGEIMIPPLADVSRPVYAEVVALSEAAATGVAWQLDLKGLYEGEIQSDAKATPDGQILWTGIAYPDIGGKVVTPWQTHGDYGLFGGNSKAGIPIDRWVQFALTLTADGTASALDIRLKELMFWFHKDIRSLNS